MHPSLIAALIEDRRRSCRCGAATDKPYQLCRKCLSRMIWRRRISELSWSVVRRQPSRRARAWARTLAAATSMRRVLAKGARS